MIVVDCTVEAGDWPDLAILKNQTEKATSAAAIKTSNRIPPGAEVSLLFADDARVRALNAQWRQKDKPTNVLSFASNEGSGPSTPILGDIVLAHETIAREADEQDKSFDAHLSHLIVHGFLHLVGYDHENDDQANEMEQLEREICASLGIADPYAAH